MVNASVSDNDNDKDVTARNRNIIPTSDVSVLCLIVVAVVTVVTGVIFKVRCMCLYGVAMIYDMRWIKITSGSKQ